MLLRFTQIEEGDGSAVFAAVSDRLGMNMTTAINAFSASMWG